MNTTETNKLVIKLTALPYYLT